MCACAGGTARNILQLVLTIDEIASWDNTEIPYAEADAIVTYLAKHDCGFRAGESGKVVFEALRAVFTKMTPKLLRSFSLPVSLVNNGIDDIATAVGDSESSLPDAMKAFSVAIREFQANDEVVRSAACVFKVIYVLEGGVL